MVPKHPNTVFFPLASLAHHANAIIRRIAISGAGLLGGQARLPAAAGAFFLGKDVPGVNASVRHASAADPVYLHLL
jgi:hypothetical protein